MHKVSEFSSGFGHWTVGTYTPLVNAVLKYFFTDLPTEEYGLIERLSFGPVNIGTDGMVNQIARIEGRRPDSSYCFYVFAQRTREVHAWKVVGRSLTFDSVQRIPDDLDVRWIT